MQHALYTSATVVEIMPMCADSPVYMLTLAPDTPFPAWSAGQFIMVHFGSDSLCSFARPFSIASIGSSTITLYIHIRGKETKHVRTLCVGDVLRIWGPLGSSYSAPTKDTLLIAGGIGIAPFVTYTNQYEVPCTLLFGHRIAEENYPLPQCSSQTTLRTYYDPKGVSLQLFLDEIREAMLSYTHGQVLACGPLPLLRYIRSLALEHNIYTEFSLEETMFCGIGACLGCVCKATALYPDERYSNSYVQSCTAGPVFPAHTIEI